MFIRGRERVAEVWRRFHLPQEGFVLTEHRGLFEARIVANADWAVDLFLLLSERLSDTVCVSLEDVRADRRWSRGSLPLAMARDAALRLRKLLVANAGLECAFYDDDDQITLSPHLEVFVYGHSDRWFYVLRDLGLERHRTLALRSWHLARHEFPPAPALEPALAEIVERLGLEAG
jgi:hypothetical protein